MPSQLSLRCSLVLLAALGIALAFGLLAAGPALDFGTIPATYADERRWLGLPAAANVLTSLLAIGIAAIALPVVGRAEHWPTELRRPLAGFFLAAGCSGLLAAAYHCAPTRLGFVGAQALLSAACAQLMLAFLAERVDLRFGSWPACLGALGAAAVAGAIWWVSGGDARMLIWFDILPVLLVPAGMLALPGPYTRRSDWMLMLGIYMAARLAELCDQALFELFGILSGHSLMHLGLAATCAVMARRVRRVVRATHAGARPRPARRTTVADQLS